MAAEIHRRLPAENLLFLADRARVPYASLSISLIARFASECFDFLLAHDPKVLVVACNTVSSVSLEDITARSPVPVIGRDRADGAGRGGGDAQRTDRRDRHQGHGPRRKAYDTALERLQAGRDGGVERRAAAGATGGGRVDRRAKFRARWWSTIWSRRARRTSTRLVLGCTHYEYFQSVLRDILGDGVSIVNTPAVTAAELENVLRDA